MQTYCKLKDGREMVVWSENTRAETLQVYPATAFDGAARQLEEVPYSAVARTDTNRAVAFRH